MFREQELTRLARRHVRDPGRRERSPCGTGSSSVLAGP